MKSVKKFWLAASVCAAALGCVAPAQAAIYTGNWDPAYGAPFPDLGWAGSATFFIPDACLAGAGWVSNIDSCSGGAMKILSAEVDFYNLAAPATVVETLTFDPSASVYKMFVADNQLTAVSSDFLGPVQAMSSIAGRGAYYFDLKFLESTRNNVALYHTLGYADPICAYTGAPAGCGLSSAMPTISITPIPEPGTFSLALLGLAGLLGVHRRRR